MQRNMIYRILNEHNQPIELADIMMRLTIWKVQ